MMRRASCLSSEIDVDLKRFIEAIRHLCETDRQIELDQLPLAQSLLELVPEGIRDADVLRELLGILDRELLEIVIDGTGVIIRQLLDLLLRQSGPPTEGRMCLESVVALVHLGGLEVRQFPQFGV